MLAPPEGTLCAPPLPPRPCPPPQLPPSLPAGPSSGPAAAHQPSPGLRLGAPLGWASPGRLPGTSTPCCPPDPDRPRPELCDSATLRRLLRDAFPAFRPPPRFFAPHHFPPLASAHTHSRRLSSTRGLAPKEGRGRASLCPKMQDARFPHPHRTSCLYRLRGLEPVTTDSASVSSSMQQE